MSTTQSEPRGSELLLTPSDIYRAAAEGVLPQADAERLVQWGYEQHFDRSIAHEPKPPASELRKGLNLVTVAYYFGAMLMISACAWFLGDKWEALGSPGILITVLIYMTAAAGLGWWLRGKGYLVGGGLLITVAVCLVPLLTYTIEDMIGLWPDGDPGAYKNYYPLIHGSWIVMELATIIASAVALRFVRFGFLTAPMAFSFWFLSMDVASLILGEANDDWESRKWISVIVGLCILLIGYGLDRRLHKSERPDSEDYAFWCYLFGMLAFWGGLTAMDSGSEVKRALYALLNIGLIGLAVKLRRTTFLIFGALGVHLYLGHLAYRVFEDSFLFPFALALLGLSLILLTVWMQRRLLARSAAPNN
ncbi:MAG TPA: hypothetical protein VJS44_21650 [Pyrinomonadaceae bacterium]|nr:hypothetical protein [Pyrinomonadaceae bacterium]